MQMDGLQPLVGEWRTEVRRPGQDEPIGGTTTFEWLEGGGYLVQRAVVENPDFPRAIMVIGPDAARERVVQHYFDSRGVARVYDITLDDGALRIWRDGPDFAQRYTGRLSDDGRTIEGAWEREDREVGWIHDFHLTYEKVG